MFKKPHRPTRVCPHRFCRPAHMLTGVLGLVGLAPLLLQGWLVVSCLVVMWLVGAAVQRSVFGKSITELEIEDAASTGTGASSLIRIERKGWSRTAVAMDFLLLVLAAQLAYATFADPQGQGDETVAAATDVMAGLLACATMGFYYFAHKMGTAPVRPKRVPVPVPSSA